MAKKYGVQPSTVRDALGAHSASGKVDPSKFRSLVAAIPDSAYAKYPSLSRGGVEEAVESFLTRTS
jgi:hypothetical protein